MTIRKAFALIILFTLSACAPKGPAKLYPGEILPATKTSLIRVKPGVSATFYQIVDRGGYQLPTPVGETDGRSVLLLPGSYKAMITFISGKTQYGYDFIKKRNTRTNVTTVSTEPDYIQFNLKAAGEYPMRIKHTQEGLWRAELFDPRSGKIVSKTTKLW